MKHHCLEIHSWNLQNAGRGPGLRLIVFKLDLCAPMDAHSRSDEVTASGSETLLGSTP